MNWYTGAWCALTGAFVATEMVAIAQGNWSGTFTENVRRLFHTHSRAGKIYFGVIWPAFSIWFFGHILELWP